MTLKNYSVLAVYSFCATRLNIFMTQSDAITAPKNQKTKRKRIILRMSKKFKKCSVK